MVKNLVCAAVQMTASDEHFWEGSLVCDEQTWLWPGIPSRDVPLLHLKASWQVLYANRAFAHIKMEAYGSAIIDATEAIELDPCYIKGYYRRGTAYLALNKLKQAKADFRYVFPKLRHASYRGLCALL
jgi:tetratricopeptide (TPR) repeat protein